MNNVKNLDEIKQRILEVENQLQLIDSKISEQLEISFFDRRKDLCKFLDVEKRIHTALLRELKWIIYE